MATLAQDVTTRLADAGMPYEAAVAWVHSAALVAHATGLGLIGEVGTVEAGVEAIAGAHTALSGLADPTVNRMWTADPGPAGREAFAAVVAANPVRDSSERPTGHALGDLYQAMSVESRKGRALCQTPVFVTDLLLELAVDPARREYGEDGLRMIDPACGTGHILVETLIHLWAHRPGSGRDIPRYRPIEDFLPAVHGVDLDPYAAAIASYRLLALACRANARRWRLVDAAHLPVNVAAADSLLGDHPLLTRGRYHAVVGNPPYITVKDKTLNERIRAAYPQVCHRTYSLALPFFALMTDLLVPGGWCSQLTANSFMKREFGKKFINEYLPTLDLRWVIDTSGAYIPGHGTPTVILVHRHQPPQDERVRTVLGVKGEPSAPADPARGLVWTAIARSVRDRLAYDRLAAVLTSDKPEQESAPVVELAGRPTVTQPSLLDLLDAA